MPAAACATLSPAHGNQAHAIEAAFRRCHGGVVRLTGGVFDSGPIEMPSHVTLWVDRGATLRAIPDPSLYDDGTRACGTIDLRGRACSPFIHISDASGVAIVGEGTIDGAGGSIMTGKTESWWQLARRAQREDGKQNVPRLIVIDGGRDVVLYRIRLTNSPNFHVAFNHVRGFTAWGVIVDTPETARNTDAFDPGASDDVTITRSFIRTGDDNVAIKAGKAGGTHFVTVSDSHFYSGHGMSIGSETNGGAAHILVRNLTLDGTTSGLRIKSDVSRGGLVEDVTYEHVCIRNSRRPIDIYTAYDKSAQGAEVPQYRRIVLRDIAGDGGQLIAQGHDERHRLDITLDDVRFPPTSSWTTEFTDFTIGSGGAAPLPPGTAGVTATAATTDRCATVFVPFPEPR